MLTLDKEGRPVQKNVGYVLKDRSDTINGKRFEFPNYKSFKPVINFILGLPIGEVSGETFSCNLTPGNDSDYFERKLRQQIEMENISGIFDKNGLGYTRIKSRQADQSSNNRRNIRHHQPDRNIKNGLQAAQDKKTGAGRNVHPIIRSTTGKYN